jgi:hypothetical protein
MTTTPKPAVERKSVSGLEEAEAVVRSLDPVPDPDAKKLFDVRPCIINIKGKDYLPVRARLLWMRHDHGTDWGISTDQSRTDRNDVIMVRAVIRDRTMAINGEKEAYWAFEEALVIATGLAEAPVEGKFPALMKAETAAIGRALAHAGYGTEWVEDEDDVVDSPVSGGTADVPIMLFRSMPEDPFLLEQQMREDLNLIAASGTMAHVIAWRAWYSIAPKEVRDSVRPMYEAIMASKLS